MEGIPFPCVLNLSREQRFQPFVLTSRNGFVIEGQDSGRAATGQSDQLPRPVEFIEPAYEPVVRCFQAPVEPIEAHCIGFVAESPGFRGRYAAGDAGTF